MHASTLFHRVNAMRFSSMSVKSSPMVSYSENRFSKAMVIYVRKQRVPSAICSSKSLPRHLPGPRYCLHSLFKTSMFQQFGKLRSFHKVIDKSVLIKTFHLWFLPYRIRNMRTGCSPAYLAKIYNGIYIGDSYEERSLSYRAINSKALCNLPWTRYFAFPIFANPPRCKAPLPSFLTSPMRYSQVNQLSQRTYLARRHL